MLQTIGLHGFKSFYGSGPVSFGRLTVLAGANSSGKSSLFQPLLLMKQTLESPYDPGPLLLEGPNVRITSADQVLSKQRSQGEDRFSIVIGLDDFPRYGAIFRKGQGGFLLSEQTLAAPGDEKSSVGLSEDEQLSVRSDKIAALAKFNTLVRVWSDVARGKRPGGPSDFVAVRDRCLIGLSVDFPGLPKDRQRTSDLDITAELANALKSIIHVPGLRGNPERDYKTTAVGRSFPGTFDNYVASVIQSWQQKGSKRLENLNRQLSVIGLNSGVSAAEVLDTRVAIEVSRLAGEGRKQSDDRVSIADVGLGVSQVLPFLVALLVARPGQIVYAEQPELHLHPASQHRLAEIIQEAVSRGVQVVMETHSSILIRGLQTLAARGAFSPGDVVLNWFTRAGSNGSTRVTSKALGGSGALDEWPADFDEVNLAAESAFLDATLQSYEALRE